ncbi:hypothetical protein Cadr_000018849 [Camelus dromedarius]|uniref:Uncharacterized protein n=1 Tax=Camelus dromedarius TaxID=9838 RepID=A0A5N4D2T9_CAMDR|nr:hypothetical protein Cadr_000018849 [Camelus dromedarius]
MRALRWNLDEKSATWKTMPSSEAGTNLQCLLRNLRRPVSGGGDLVTIQMTRSLDELQTHPRFLWCGSTGCGLTVQILGGDPSGNSVITMWGHVWKTPPCLRLFPQPAPTFSHQPHHSRTS